MGTLTALLNLSQSALQASQAAIEITANNVANSNTPGYTDQIAIWRANDTVSLSGVTSLGEGPSVTALSQRDPVLNHRVQQQTQLESSSSTESIALQDLQSLFGITIVSTSAVSTTIGTDINSFFNSLSALEASPSNSSVRCGILNAATALASDFNGTSAQIAQQTSSLNQQVSANVTQINAVIPQKFVPYAPLVLIAIGQITKMLRQATTGPVGAKGNVTPPANVKAGD